MGCTTTGGARPGFKRSPHLADPESCIIEGSDGLVRAYNTQAAGEPLCELIVRQTVTQAANDKQQLVPLVEDPRTIGTETGRSPGRSKR
jgi:hypothetical protein